MLLEQSACVFGQIGHVFKTVSPFFPQPFVDLFPPKRLIALSDKKIAQGSQIEGPNVLFALCCQA